MDRLNTGGEVKSAKTTSVSELVKEADDSNIVQFDVHNTLRGKVASILVFRTEEGREIMEGLKQIVDATADIERKKVLSEIEEMLDDRS